MRLLITIPQLRTTMQKLVYQKRTVEVAQAGRWSSCSPAPSEGGGFNVPRSNKVLLTSATWKMANSDH